MALQQGNAVPFQNTMSTEIVAITAVNIFSIIIIIIIIITRRMAIINGTCVSFCNQPKAQFGYLRRVTPVCRYLTRFAGGGI